MPHRRQQSRPRINFDTSCCSVFAGGEPVPELNEGSALNPRSDDGSGQSGSAIPFASTQSFFATASPTFDLGQERLSLRWPSYGSGLIQADARTGRLALEE
jgi:hypothetical protein